MVGRQSGGDGTLIDSPNSNNGKLWDAVEPMTGQVIERSYGGH